MEFLRNSDTGRLSGEQLQIANRRAAVMAADRKRRLSGQQEEPLQRRSASHASYRRPSSERIRHNIVSSTSSDEAISRSFEHRSGRRITDRPLPPRPDAEDSPNGRSRDLSIPAWQADAEVSDCPICGHRFNFWYRKHHCRKCGMVVCASCSPHRITIPRQFIVRPPSGLYQSFDAAPAPLSPTVDLTGDDGSESPSMHTSPSAQGWQNQENEIDTALGGGQEVRLCNPCVPDPNPSPHLPFTPPSWYASFSGSENPTRLRSEQSTSSPHNEQRLGVSHELESDHGFGRPRNDAAAEFDAEEHPPRSPFTETLSSVRRQRHALISSNEFSNYPPNHSLIYGSAPDPSFHEVSMKTAQRFPF